MGKGLPWRKHSKESQSGYINIGQGIQSKELHRSTYQEDIAMPKVCAPKNSFKIHAAKAVRNERRNKQIHHYH